MSKYDDCHRVDNRYTTAIGMSVWHRKVDSFTCNNIFVRFITAYPPVTGVAS